jgi:epithelial splicing regulatory protein 1/2
MRLLLHPEATNKNINLAKYFHKFFDLRKEFKKFYKFENVTNIKDMLECILFTEMIVLLFYGTSEFFG